MICQIVTTNGRPFIHDSLASYAKQVSGPITRRILWDDSGDQAVRDDLIDRYEGEWLVSWPGDEAVGYSESIRRLWILLHHLPERFVFHCEDDFLFNVPVDLGDVCAFLDKHKEVAEVTFLRNRCYPAEMDPATVLGHNPKRLKDRKQGPWRWSEHTMYFSANPSVYRKDLVQLGWPLDKGSEMVVTHRILAQGQHFAYWGHKKDEPTLTHIGEYRADGSFGY